MFAVQIAFNIGKLVVCAGAALVAGSIARRYAFEAGGEIITAALAFTAKEIAGEVGGGAEGAAASL